MGKTSGYWNEWTNLERELKKAIRENGALFPTRKKLGEMGYGGLIYGIGKHGGFAAVRERIGYNEQMRTKLAKDLEKIVETL